MNRYLAFAVLLALALLFLAIGRQLEPHFLSDLWSQLFMLTAGTLATTFVLDAVLRRDAKTSQRKRDMFAFRTFSANVLLTLQKIVRAKKTDSALLHAAVLGNAQFAQRVEEAVQQIAASGELDTPFLNAHYLDIGSALRSFSSQHIRLFSSSRQDMADRYIALNELAGRWRYRPEFSEGDRKSIERLPAGDPDRKIREKAFADELALAQRLVTETARMVGDLVDRMTNGKGFYE